MAENNELERTLWAAGEYTTSVTKVLDQAELLADYWTKSEQEIATAPEIHFVMTPLAPFRGIK